MMITTDMTMMINGAFWMQNIKTDQYEYVTIILICKNA